ncbi:MAG: DUF4250 domain-containing protein [Lachnospiraceae bacterium]|nr:DUF4250 domain-containing protein [Lachnospiraceae bacterium]
MLPQDPVILLSVLNTKLRDKYSSLMELCDDLDEDEASLLVLMDRAGYVYDREKNQFKPSNS